MGNIMRRLEALERALGDDAGEDFGPSLVITFTHYWRDVGSGAAGDPAGADGATQERAALRAAVAQVREEARARRQRLGIVTATVGKDGRAQFSGVPWRPVGEELAWRQGRFPKRDA
jgi:hypothetical protein